MQFNRAIPGQSLTTPPKSAPYERPPQISDPLEAIDYHLEQLDDPKTVQELMFFLEMGMDLSSLVEAVARKAVFDGIHSIDISLSIAPVIHEYIKGYADAMDIDYDEGFEDKEEEENLMYGRRLLLAKKMLAEQKEKQEGEGNMRDGERTYFEDLETDEIDPEMVTTPEDIELRKTIREGQGDMASNEPKGLMART